MWGSILGIPCFFRKPPFCDVPTHTHKSQVNELKGFGCLWLRNLEAKGKKALHVTAGGALSPARASIVLGKGPRIRSWSTLLQVITSQALSLWGVTRLGEPNWGPSHKGILLFGGV